MTQRELGEACGMHRMVISHLECGRRSIKLGEAVTLASVLGVDLAALVSSEPLVLHVHTEVPID